MNQVVPDASRTGSISDRRSQIAAQAAGRRALPWAPRWLSEFLRINRRRALAARMRAVTWLQRRGVPCRMSREAYVFDRFKRARAAMCTEDLSGLHVPAERGLVSIVLPVYNGEQYLREALDSALAQRGPSFELIAVDDGSADRTPEILAEYARHDPRLRVIAQANQQLPRALSAGFRDARGEFLTWMSADNRLKPGSLEKMSAGLRRHPGWDMIYANEDLIDAGGRPCRHSPWFPFYQRPMGSEHIWLPTDVSELNTRADNFVGAAFMYRARARFLLGDYSSERFALEDYDYWMRMNALLTLRHSDFNEPVCDYRFHEQSLTSRHGELGISERMRQLMVFDDFRRGFCLTPLVWRIQTDAADERCRRLAAELTQAALEAGHLAPDLAALPAGEAARSCIVNVKVLVDAAQAGAPASDPPASALNVLLAIPDAPLPSEMPGEWDLCAAWSSTAQPPRLAGDRQGWLVTHDLLALLAAIDIRARSQHLARIEAEAAARASRSPLENRARVGLAVMLRRCGDRLRRWRRPHVLRP